MNILMAKDDQRTTLGIEYEMRIGCFTVAQLAVQLSSQLCKVGSLKLGLFFSSWDPNRCWNHNLDPNFASQLCTPTHLSTLHCRAKHDKAQTDQLCPQLGRYSYLCFTTDHYWTEFKRIT